MTRLQITNLCNTLNFRNCASLNGRALASNAYPLPFFFCAASSSNEVPLTDSHPIVQWTTPHSPAPARPTAAATASANAVRMPGDVDGCETAVCLYDSDPTRTTAVVDDRPRLPRPPPPVDVRAVQYVGGGDNAGTIRVSWTVPRPPMDDIDEPLVLIDHYTVEYRAEDDWVQLANNIAPVSSTDDIDDGDDSGDGNETMISYLWTTASPGVVYQFRVFSVSRDSVPSEPSETVMLLVAGQYDEKACFAALSLEGARARPVKISSRSVR